MGPINLRAGTLLSTHAQGGTKQGQASRGTGVLHSLTAAPFPQRSCCLWKLAATSLAQATWTGGAQAIVIFHLGRRSAKHGWDFNGLLIFQPEKNVGQKAALRRHIMPHSKQPGKAACSPSQGGCQAPSDFFRAAIPSSCSNEKWGKGPSAPMLKLPMLRAATQPSSLTHRLCHARGSVRPDPLAHCSRLQDGVATAELQGVGGRAQHPSPGRERLPCPIRATPRSCSVESSTTQDWQLHSNPPCCPPSDGAHHPTILGCHPSGQGETGRAPWLARRRIHYYFLPTTFPPSHPGLWFPFVPQPGRSLLHKR